MTQWTLTPFFTSPYNWALFGYNRIQPLEEDPDTKLLEGDALAPTMLSLTTLMLNNYSIAYGANRKRKMKG